MIAKKGGCRWPRRGKDCADRTLGCALVGPGPIKSLEGTCEGPSCVTQQLLCDASVPDSHKLSRSADWAALYSTLRGDGLALSFSEIFGTDSPGRWL